MVWLGLGKKTATLGLGKHHVILPGSVTINMAGNRCDALLLNVEAPS